MEEVGRLQKIKEGTGKVSSQDEESELATENVEFGMTNLNV